ncbi:MAG: hypothetical protein ACREQN_05440 [Candidatus Binataceae bacterium]
MYIFLAQIFSAIIFLLVLVVALSALYANGIKPMVRKILFRRAIGALSRRGELTPARLREAAERFKIPEEQLTKFGKLLNTYRSRPVG